MANRQLLRLQIYIQKAGRTKEIGDETKEKGGKNQLSGDTSISGDSVGGQGRHNLIEFVRDRNMVGNSRDGLEAKGRQEIKIKSREKKEARSWKRVQLNLAREASAE